MGRSLLTLLLGVVAVTYEEALISAQRHVDESPLDHPEYRTGFSGGRVLPEGWYFDYTIEPIRPIPESEREQFAGAPGFIVLRTGEAPRAVSWAEFTDRNLSEAPPASEPAA
jgi:hypothetical protein